ncbi:MAG: hypothetical protein ACD_51C00071G0002 [uncultured bacterium]|nr:MAG: hypothetical protein ACD_51C00071G0002 [uncultured bacterium]OGJ47012.1 MAG: hypothetical protein A2244_04710 [Candidatus Peregrinibacteria bacterium RIFOXYA2_FULL_41_18]OGJ47742.1 MAG: hypothetical protein A2344_00865 [Candidatus Peregrinibacteria bacterium RIFOXYB12_FULL_41_12]OGJ53074.1 MAG: hypothetical protein A2448_01045 [Candidatus Peregrinibacteria bacterium RIFOXYC2_FULL_41_22]
MRKVNLILVPIIMLFAGCGASYTPSADAQDSPENVVKSFYEAFAVSPDSALQFVSAEAQENEKFQRNWEEIQTWEFTKVEVVEFSDPYVTIDMEVIIDGEADSATDEAEVEEIDGKWWIVSIPT